ncbi:hypothetical protein CHGG_05958 [Chaetomium globosum CBS 148.51]|uniref:Uncharacterized protein n=1 Tax=Chaetomium globosum (strain ATCC 6205 / CBS 148.51 / DSM 1962 / NBRC 6347 / NRRL 1970) TaxID=306901 RepID=Q2H5V7_CHAGB|nr:uncharacterized protein CHGG_05958 [Chaetomium globosum CBS 148.51]EAQ89339.1 hypothetical protein CHGG_05958 [Chaetomium globosum CBS 148.51]
MTHPRLLLLDFDGTITQDDSLASLIALAIEALPSYLSPSPSSSPPHQQNPPSPPTTITTPPHKDKPALTSLWTAIVHDYLAAHAAHRASYRPAAEERATLAAELAFLESVAPVEQASVRRVGEAGFFRGLGEGRLEEVGRRAVRLGCQGGETEGGVRVRKGLGEFLGRFGGGGGGNDDGKGWDVAVVSVNWSGAFIKGVVEAAGGNGGIRRVVANGIGFPGGMIEGPPELGKEPLVTAGDKLRAMKSAKSGLEGEKVVYFGDSATDLACLVAADLGVVMADDGETKLLKILARIGFEVPHVQEAAESDQLVWGRDFEEVLQSGVMERI